MVFHVLRIFVLFCGSICTRRYLRHRHVHHLIVIITKVLVSYNICCGNTRLHRQWSVLLEILPRHGIQQLVSALKVVFYSRSPHLALLVEVLSGCHIGTPERSNKILRCWGHILKIAIWVLIGEYLLLNLINVYLIDLTCTILLLWHERGRRPNIILMLTIVFVVS